MRFDLLYIFRVVKINFGNKSKFRIVFSNSAQKDLGIIPITVYDQIKINRAKVDDPVIVSVPIIVILVLKFGKALKNNFK